jgi:hypothetical protein
MGIAIDLPKSWRDISAENPDGPATYVNSANPKSGALQISFAFYRGGEVPSPSKSDLVDLSKGIGIKNNLGKLVKTNSGKCKFGIFGSAYFSGPENPIFALWHLSNGKDFVMVTYINTADFNKSELKEAERIVGNIQEKRD